MVQRLGDLDQMKKDILSQVSHELKAPLAGMQETAQLMLEGVPGPLTPDQRHLLELNVESARRLSGMISKMLDLARLDAGASSCDLGSLDLIPLLRSAAEASESGAGARGVTLRLELPHEAVGVWGDRDRLFQVATNLMENACKFSPPGAEVVLAAEVVPDLPAGAPAWALGPLAGFEGGGLVRVTLADRGPGVPEEEKVLIFERFHQVRREGRSRLGGVGLGLAICRDIVVAHGGALWVSDRPGGGSVFTLCLRNVPAPPAEVS
jgi:signal transduction histidine kinase